MKLSLVFFLLLCGTAVCQIAEYIYITEQMSWFDAQRHCRENYVDLATITTDEENWRVKNAGCLKKRMGGWIGLNRTKSGLNIWKWSDGTPVNFTRWASNQPDYYRNKENCGMVYPHGWNDMDCGNKLNFYCYSGFVLVKDNKTWEEALEYCRTKYTGLASPIFKEQRVLARIAITKTQTVSVWAGLHFMNGLWASVNCVPLRNWVPLPSCLANRYRCGALHNKMHLWENRDCSEKLNFLCY